VSPYDHADLIHAPLLLVHGAEDANSGTYPLQSERLFQALQGLGGTARLVVLPAEEHGYRARESVLHVAAEMLQWVERHVPEPTEVPQ
jgi:dipeptidyl aminopeptidase/acylaminoacyl peptidase